MRQSYLNRPGNVSAQSRIFGRLALDTAPEAINVNDPPPVQAPGDRFVTVVGLNLERHDGAINQDDPGPADNLGAFGHGRQVLDLDVGPHASLVIRQARGQRGPGGSAEAGGLAARQYHSLEENLRAVPTTLTGSLDGVSTAALLMSKSWCAPGPPAVDPSIVA